MAFLTLEDSYGSVEALVFPKILATYSHQLQEGAVVLVKGTLSIREDEEPKILLNAVESLDSALDSVPEKKVLYIRLETNAPDTFTRVRESLAPFKGDIEVRLYFMDTKKVVRVPENLYFNGSPSAMRELKFEFGDSNVAFKTL